MHEGAGACAEYLGMLRKHDPEHYKDTLLILDAIHHAYEY